MSDGPDRAIQGASEPAGGPSPAQATAEAAARAMWATDRASQALGMNMRRVAPGEAVLAMEIRTDMTNGHGICHGGFVFTLADSAFAFACNSHGQRTVAHHCAVTFMRPVAAGARLEAHAVERALQGRNGIYDVTVRDADGAIVAVFQGHSRTIAGSLVEAGAGEPNEERRGGG